MKILAFIEDTNVLFEFLLALLGIAVAIFLLMVLYRLYGVLGRMDLLLKDFSIHRRMIKDLMIEFRKFCLRHNQPPPYPDADE